MKRVLSLLCVVPSLVFGCATGTTSPEEGGERGSTSSSGTSAASGSSSGASSSSSSSGGGAGGASGVAKACPPDEFIANIDAKGELACSPLDALTKSAFDQGCRIHLGASDACGPCVDPPAKWGRISPNDCYAVGANNTCQSVMLDGANMKLFGLNLDGNVDDNDKLYARFGCDTAPLAEGPGPCEAGELVVGSTGGSPICGAAAAGILDALRTSCEVTLGARDNCDACNDPPLTWGQASSTQCDLGSGGDNTCTKAMLEGKPMELIGVDLSGNVDGNDKLYMGLHCAAPASAPAKGVSACPAGQYASGVTADGLLDCAPVGALAVAYFEAHCSLYLGWSDGCNGCLGAPQKWGKTSAAACMNGAGADASCIEAALSGQVVRLFGLSFDGDVNDDDTIFVGLRCE